MPAKSDLKLSDLGEIISPRTLIMRYHVGKAEHDEHGEFEVATGVPNCAPIVMSLKTKKMFSLSWAEIIDMAIARGILEEDDPAEGEGKDSG